MNHLRRSTRGMVVLFVITSTLVSCTGDDVKVTPTERPMAEFMTDRWIDLPASPLGEWDRYNWVYLADR